MCLIIDKTIHSDEKPIHRNVDIFVYKYLEYKKNGYITPFQQVPVKFINGIAILKSVLSRQYVMVVNSPYNLKEFCQTVCERGIHCFINKPPFKIEAFPAIIPRETMFFVGKDNDIASAEVIIFKNWFYYWKYTFLHGRPLKASKLYGNKNLL